MNQDREFHRHDELLRRRTRGLAPDQIRRELKPLVRVPMASMNAAFRLPLPRFCHNNILRLQKRS